jgi:hypothetical protein
MTPGKVPIPYLCLLGLLLATTAQATNVYNVSDYASPQAAINAAQAAGGGLVHFPCGPTTLTAGLVVSSPGVTLEGCGPTGTTLWASFATGDIISFSNSTPYTPCGGVRSLTISPSVNRTSGYAIAIAGCGSGNFENLAINSTSNAIGNGMHFSDSSNSLASTIFVRAVTIFIHGAFTAIRIDGANDRFFSHLSLSGDYPTPTAGSRGILITSSAGDWFSDIESTLFEIGVELSPGSGQSVLWANFNNVLADTNSWMGFHFGGTGAIDGISCVRCWASTNGTASGGGRGFEVNNGSGLTFTDSRVINNGGQGFNVTSGAADINIAGGIFAGNCLASAGCTNGGAYGILLTGTNGFRISGVRAGTTAGQSNTQGYGILINTGCDNYIVTGNDTRLNVWGGIVNVPGTGPTRVLANNL